MPDSSIRFEKVNYDSLNAKQQDSHNFQKLAGTLAGYGFNCIKLADDWHGADFLASHIDGNTTIKVQLKSRLTIDDEYRGNDIWIAFPHKDCWYLIQHDRLVEKVRAQTDWLNRLSWKDEKRYSSARSNARLMQRLAEDRLEP